MRAAVGRLQRFLDVSAQACAVLCSDVCFGGDPQNCSETVY